MPTLDLSELNIVLAVLGAFIVLYGAISIKIKQKWYLGEALPAVLLGIALGPVGANFINSERWGSATPGQQERITLGMARVVIGVQLVIAGYQLPAKYQKQRWLEMLICLLPVMTIMWLCTTACVVLTIPKISLLAALTISSNIVCTDPILSQCISKGPFSELYVPRALRELISSEAGANDGLGFPYLLLATFLIRHADVPGAGSHEDPAHRLAKRGGEVGRLGGGVGKALEQWAVEAWLYIVFLSVAYGIVIGYGSCLTLKYALRKKWIDGESFLLWPTALGLFIVGSCGLLGTDDLLCCFVAGNMLNWNGQFLAETEARHDEVNSCVDVILNFGGFMYIGTVIPWRDFQLPDVTGITVARLMLLGFLILIFRRLPAIFITYKFMPKVVRNWKDALFMGYFGPIGIGAVFYVEHTRHLFPKPGEGDEEENNLTAAMVPVVYWLVLFSIVVHGLSIPALNLFYKWRGVQPIREEAVEVQLLSVNQPTPKNARRSEHRNSIIYHNRFTRPQFHHFHWPSSMQLMHFHHKSRDNSEEALHVARPPLTASHSERSVLEGTSYV